MPLSSAQPFLRIVSDDTESLNLLLDEDQAAQALTPDLCRFVESFDDEYFQIEPWFIFNAWVDLKPPTKTPTSDIFRAWQLYHWTPDPATVSAPCFDENTKTIAQAYLKKNREHLSQQQIFILSEAHKHPLDLYEVVALNGDYLLLYGLIGQKKVAAYNPALTLRARIGEYILAALLPIDQMRSIFLGHSDLLHRNVSSQVNEFCDFIDRCEMTPRTFQNFESDLFNLFYDLSHSQCHEQPRP